MRGLMMMENDYEIIYLAQENDEIATQYIINKYKYIIDIIIVKNKAKIVALKVEKEDVYNIGLFAMHQAISSYNADIASFASFVSILINRYINNFLKLNNRKKDSIYINSCSLNEDIAADKLLLDMKINSPDFLVMQKENCGELHKKICNRLTNLEKSVYNLLIDFTPQEIAFILNVDIKKVHNTIGRIRNKTQKLLANMSKV